MHRSRESLDALGALAEPNRRALYEYVIGQDRWVSRDEAADGIGIRRSVAAHHLDRLAGDGLLDVDYQRRSGRSGPGAGRPSKVYRRSSREIEVALPPRDYELAGRLLADAIDAAARGSTHIDDAVEDVARAEGRAMGRVMRQRLGRARSDRRLRESVVAVLAEHGFEPVEIDPDTVVLRNCPFHQLAQSHTDLICGMNHCLLDAALGELDAGPLEARLEPDPASCCVRLRAR
jgi:predicted ArsR family transcriptional regulator